jgi:hypothetical protein
LGGGMTDRRHHEEDQMDRGTQLHETTDELVSEVIRVAVTLEELFSSFLPSIPDGAFPGEDKAQVLFDMVLGSVEPATAAAGEKDCRTAIALIGAMRERILADLHTAAESCREQEADR